MIPPPSQKFGPESDDDSSDTSSDAGLQTPKRKYRAAGSAASLYTATAPGSGTRYSVGMALNGSAGGTPRVGSYGRSGSVGGGGGGGGEYVRSGGEGYASMSAGGSGFGRMAYVSEQGSVRG